MPLHWSSLSLSLFLSVARRSAACACWSWGRAGSLCFLLSNDTAPAIPDGGAVSGFKPSWVHARSFASFSSASASPTVITPTPAGELLAVDLGVPASFGIRASRHLLDGGNGGDLLLRFDLANVGPSRRPVELGAFGWSCVVDNLFTGRSLDQIALESSFSDPAINGGAGYVQAVSTTGTGPVLLIMPEPATNTSFEAWRLLQEDPTPRGVTFEG